MLVSQRLELLHLLSYFALLTSWLKIFHPFELFRTRSFMTRVSVVFQRKIFKSLIAIRLFVLPNWVRIIKFLLQCLPFLDQVFRNVKSPQKAGLDALREHLKNKRSLFVVLIDSASCFFIFLFVSLLLVNGPQALYIRIYEVQELFLSAFQV